MPHLMPHRILPARSTAAWTRAAAAALTALALGCANPTDLATPESMPSDGPSLIREVEGKLRVDNFQLRAIDDLCCRRSSASGHLQLKATRLGDGSVRVAYKGQIFNPEGETFTGFAIGRSGDGRSAVLIALGEVDGRSDRRIDPEDATILSAEVAARLYGTPDTIDDPNLYVVFFTTQHPAGAIGSARAPAAVE